ncbi:MAG TPA: hypothetical protein VFG91_02940 [Woeseiaceae bacterium]|nr:hypothetical protein [Woeseiaceae bacterium]
MDLLYFARKYIWWEPPEIAVQDRHRVIAQVMNLGTFEDARSLLRQAGEMELKQALREARPGEFSARSWNYWHLILGVSPLQAVPPLPVRRFA